jgi:hypothetical protein
MIISKPSMVELRCIPNPEAIAEGMRQVLDVIFAPPNSERVIATKT